MFHLYVFFRDLMMRCFLLKKLRCIFNPYFRSCSRKRKYYCHPIAHVIRRSWMLTIKKDGTLPEMKKIIGANIQYLPREEVPLGISGFDEIVQVCLFILL